MRSRVLAVVVVAMPCLMIAGGATQMETAAGDGHPGAHSFSTVATDGVSPLGWRVPSQVAEFRGLGQGVEFGRSTSVSGDGSTAIIGATGYAPTGAAFVYSESAGSWQQRAKLLPSDPMSGEDYGYSVAISADGSTAIVGAPFPSSNVGAVYVYKLLGGSWQEVARLSPSEGGSFFGSGVALSANGSTALIGAYGTNGETGAAFVFSERKGIYSQTAKIEAPGGAIAFGNAVSLSRDGTTALIGANGEEFFTNAAYIYTEAAGSWELAAAIADPDATNSDNFGGAVAISADGSTAVIGAEGDHSYLGAAYVYTRDDGAWALTTKLLAAGGQSGDLFGISVGVGAHGSRVLVGAMGQGTYTGAAYVFNHGATGLRQVATLSASDRGGYNFFGSSAALSANGTTAVIGSDAYPAARYDGAAYVFRARGAGSR